MSIFSKMLRASLTRPARVSASTYQNEQRLNVPSPPSSPSWPVLVRALVETEARAAFPGERG